MTEGETCVKIEFFDPEMCCSTGVCGPSPDPELMRVSEMIQQLKAQGHKVTRHMMSRNPMEFASNKQVYQAILGSGPSALPIVVAEGRVIAQGRYPKLDDLLAVGG